MSEPLSLLLIVRNQVKPWFERYGATLTDATSFRNMIDMAQRDRDGLAALVPSYRKAKLPDIVADAEEDIREADALIAAMRARLAAILEGAGND